MVLVIANWPEKWRVLMRAATQYFELQPKHFAIPGALENVPSADNSPRGAEVVALRTARSGWPEISRNRHGLKRAHV